MDQAVTGAGFSRALHNGVPGLSATLPRATAVLRSDPDPHRGLALSIEALSPSLPGCALAVLLPARDGLRVAAASTNSLTGLECVDAACTDGPAEAAYRTKHAHSWRQVRGHGSGRFDAAAKAAGFRSAYGLPLSDGAACRGALLIVSSEARRLSRNTLERLRMLTGAMAHALARAEPYTAADSSMGDGTDHETRKEPLA